MSRTLVAAYVSKLADVTTGMDILARAQFWEGAAGYLPFQKIRGQTNPASLQNLIKALMREVNPALVDWDGNLQEGQTAPETWVWWHLGNTKLYLPVLLLANKIVSKQGMEGEDILQEDMARDDRLGSVFYSAGKQTAKHLLEKLQAGLILPTDAQVVARRFVARHAIDAIRAVQNRDRLEREHGGDIVQMTTETELDSGDWTVVIDRLLADPTHPLAKDFFSWLRDYAVKLKSPVLVDYLDAVMSGGPVDQGAIAAAAGTSEAALSMAKKNFFAHIAAMLSGKKGTKPPAILNILSDAQFLYQLLKGKVHGDKVGAEDKPAVEPKSEDKPEERKEASLRSKVIRLAHAKPEFRAKLLAALGTKTAAPKAPKKLTGKKLAEAISKAYYKQGNGVQINIMDITKIFDAGKAAYEGGATVEEAEKALEEAMIASVAKYRLN